MPITPSRTGHLLDALSRTMTRSGCRSGRAGRGVQGLVLARTLELTSKLDSLRVLAEAGMDPPSSRIVKHLRLRRRRRGRAAMRPPSGGAEPASGRWLVLITAIARPTEANLWIESACHRQATDRA